jgi:hypothetical protein
MRRSLLIRRFCRRGLSRAAWIGTTGGRGTTSRRGLTTTASNTTTTTTTTTTEETSTTTETMELAKLSLAELLERAAPSPPRRHGSATTTAGKYHGDNYSRNQRQWCQMKLKPPQPPQQQQYGITTRTDRPPLPQHQHNNNNNDDNNNHRRHASNHGESQL